MVTTVKTQPNHYELLGLTPGASDGDIGQAFATKVGPLCPRPVSELAQIILAYETLRDPTKRRAYDDSIRPKPEPPPPPQWSVMRRDGWPIVRPSQVAPTAQPRAVTAHERQPTPQPRPDPTEPRLPPFLAASLRNAAGSPGGNERGAVRSQPEPTRRAPASAMPAALLERRNRSNQTDVERRLLLDAEDGSFAWKRPAMAAGALFVSFGLLGAWLGWDAGNAAQQPSQTVTLPIAEAKASAIDSRDAALPSASEEPTAASRSPTPSVRASAEAPPVRRAGAVAAAPEPGLARQASNQAPPEEQQAQTASEQSRIDDIAAALAESPAVAATPAKLPLPNSVVARTIGRIGYACGSVASMTPADGAPAGVFKVTCTSGDSYRAAPVGGRYRFRRWGRQ